MEYSNNIKRLREILDKQTNKTNLHENVDNGLSGEVSNKIKECQTKIDSTKNEKEKLKIYESFLTSIVTIFEGVKTII